MRSQLCVLSDRNFARCLDQQAYLTFEVIVVELQTYNLVVQAFQKVVKAGELHASLAVLAKKVLEQPSVIVPGTKPQKT